jgi:hypothetical protein
VNDKLIIGMVSTVVACWAAGQIAKTMGKGQYAQAFDTLAAIAFFTTTATQVGLAIAAFYKLIKGI